MILVGVPECFNGPVCLTVSYLFNVTCTISMCEIIICSNVVCNKSFSFQTVSLVILLIYKHPPGTSECHQVQLTAQSRGNSKCRSGCSQLCSAEFWKFPTLEVLQTRFSSANPDISSRISSCICWVVLS